MSNKNNDIENRLKSEFESITPNNLDRIKATVDSDASAKILELPKKKRPIYKKFVCAVAAMFVLCALGAATILSTTSGSELATIISLDVNPGVELTINEKDEITDTRATNSDGESILKGLSLDGKDINEGLDIIIDKLVDSGYISSDANSVLVSVNSSEQTSAKKIENLVTEKITATLSKNGVEASIISQIVEKDEEIEELAEEYKMSDGKARLINELAKKDGRHTFDELSTLTVNELSVLLNETKTMPNDVKKHGKVSKKDYISSDEALQSALSYVNAQKSEIKNLSLELDYLKKHGENSGSMVYDVRFIFNDTEYRFDVGAKNGEILKEKSDRVDEDTPPPPKKPRPQNTIGKEMAMDIAQNAGFNPSSDADFDIELECDDDGNWYYDVEIPSDASVNGDNASTESTDETNCETNCETDLTRPYPDGSFRPSDKDDCNHGDDDDDDDDDDDRYEQGDRDDYHKPLPPSDGDSSHRSPEKIRIDAISGNIIKR